MKLKKIWKHIDSLTQYTIWYANSPYEEFKKIKGEIYEGCPKWLKDYHLIVTANNEYSEAICPYSYESEYGAKLNGIRITVVKEQ